MASLPISGLPAVLSTIIRCTRDGKKTQGKGSKQKLYQEFLVRAQLERETLEALIQEEWLIPGQSAGELTFSDANIARAQLIRDLKNDLGVAY
jgi:hypothetical protein